MALGASPVAGAFRSITADSIATGGADSTDRVAVTALSGVAGTQSAGCGHAAGLGAALDGAGGGAGAGAGATGAATEADALGAGATGGGAGATDGAADGEGVSCCAVASAPLVKYAAPGPDVGTLVASAPFVYQSGAVPEPAGCGVEAYVIICKYWRYWR
jgi:hypothetical protein